MSETRLRETPYQGLMPFSEEDASFFFGRDSEREIISANLRASRLTVLYGPSGVGKSSVLRAGVAYSLREIARRNLAKRGTPRFAVVVFSSWRDDPIVGLANRVESSTRKALESRPLDPVPSSSVLADTLGAWTKYVGGDLLIILDQFEDYFLYHDQEDGEGTFATEFPRAVNRSDLRVHFLISIRADALTKLDRFKRHIPNLFDNRLRLEHLGRVAAIEAIRGPLDQYNRDRPDDRKVTVEDELVEAIVTDKEIRAGQFIFGEGGQGKVAKKPGREVPETRIETPCLQMMVTRLWDEERKLGSRRLRLDTFKRLGGPLQILRTHLDRVMEKLSKPEREIAARVFRLLVTPSGTRVARNVIDLASDDDVELPGKQVQSVLTLLSPPEDHVQPVSNSLSALERYILRRVEAAPDAPQSPRYEIFHDVLAPAVLDWRRRYFAQQKAKHQRLVVGGLAMGLLAALLLAGIAVWGWIEAYQQRTQAEEHHKEANQQRLKAEKEHKVASSLILARGFDSEDNLELALLLSLEANQISDTVEAKSSLLAGLVSCPHLTMFLHGHKDRVRSVAFSPDGKTLASGSADKKVILWDVSSGHLLSAPLTGHEGVVYSVTFSPDGKTLASGSDDQTIRLWDVATGLGQPLTGLKDMGAVFSVAFSPDGKTLVSGSADKTIMWDVASRKPLGEPFTGHKGDVYRVAFSPDGKRLATGSADKTILLWDVATRRRIGECLTGHDDEVTSIAFSPDGRTLASGGADKTVILWDVATPKRPFRRLSGHKNLVYSVAFSPDGKTLASGSSDKTIILWDVANGKRRDQPLTGYPDRVFSVAFSPDGKALASGSAGTIVLWDPEDVATRRERRWAPQPLGEYFSKRDRMYSAAMSPDGKTLASANADGMIMLWDMATHKPLGPPLEGHTQKVSSVAFSLDGKTLASGSADQTIILWDVDRREPRGQPLEGHTKEVSSVAFSPDGKTLASGSLDETIILWDVDKRKPRGQPLEGHTKEVSSVAFSPDGKTLASGSLDETIILWDVDKRQLRDQLVTDRKDERVFSLAFNPKEGKMLASGNRDSIILWNVADRKPLSLPLTKHKEHVASVAFSPDGNMLASGSGDQTVILWDVTARNPLGRPLGKPLTGHTDTVSNLAFTPDSKKLMSGSGAGTVILWDVSFDSWKARAGEIVSRNLTPEEWEQYLGDERYRETSPNAALQLADQYALERDENASVAFEQAVQQAIKTSDFKLNNSVGWYGSIDGFAKIVLPACEHAVKLAPENGQVRDTRGLARALTGHSTGAIEDFEFFVKWLKENEAYEPNFFRFIAPVGGLFASAPVGPLHVLLALQLKAEESEPIGPKREAWIAKLKAGGDPFDRATLRKLRQE